jgi:hypothetical protein
MPDTCIGFHCGLWGVTTIGTTYSGLPVDYIFNLLLYNRSIQCDEYTDSGSVLRQAGNYHGC